ncbi:2'-5' RNA ligase family protein [Actinoplanes sp. NPDC051859]|uniref:2'-5' RNA ligase family protein n=1 Tax=Actinoplanes sp. NPDC051859 TaxID=3363909 RepID=UPI0037A17F64
MHTVELLLDPQLERHVRELWDRLHDAGLPSLATHRHRSNRPHLTVITAATLTGVPSIPLPLPVELGPVRFLGRALIRSVTPSTALDDLHGSCWSALRDADPWPDPQHWVPHVSLALKVDPEHQVAALALLAAEPPARGTFVAARSYDSRTRTATDL